MDWYQKPSCGTSAHPRPVYPKNKFSSKHAIRKRSDYFEQGRVEDVKLEFSGYSQVFFVRAFAVFWIRMVIFNRCQCPIGVPQNPVDDKMAKVE